MQLNPTVRLDDERLNGLAREIQSRRYNPVDSFEIAAMLESMGWNDARIHAEFGYQSVFHLARTLWDEIVGQIQQESFYERKRVRRWKASIEQIRTFIRGVIFAVPMGISVAAMLTLRLSLWSYENLSVDLATAIAIGTILSFITVGGFTQAIARRGYFYVIQGYYVMGRRITFLFMGLGFAVCVLVSILMIVLNTLIQVLPYHMLVVAVGYFFFLSAIWLSVTAMYILRKELVFAGLIVFGIALVAVLFYGFGQGIILSQTIALITVSICSILLVRYFFTSAEKKGEKGIAPKLPQMSITMYSVIPYLTYGMLYFAYLYVDRVLAWSTNDAFMPYPIWFRGNYELGLDFGLLILILPMGFSEVALGKLMRDIQECQQGSDPRKTMELGERFVRSYRNRIGFIGVVSIASAASIYGIMEWVLQRFPHSIGHTLFSNSTTYFVFLWSIGGYILISLSLMNAVTLFSLSVPILVLRSLWPALIVNVSVGFLLTRWIDYKFAVIGMVVGGLVFTWLSTKNVTKVLRNLNFYLYAAS